MKRSAGKNRKPRLILASASPRRRALMRAAGYRFRVVPSRVSERIPPGLSPVQLVRTLALKKARAVARRNPADLVLGADTLVFIDGRILGKPRGPQDAVRMLRTLSGAWQRVATGVAVVWDGGRRTSLGSATSWVRLRVLSEADIRRASRRHLDKAGAYAVQEKGDAFVERIRGDYDNVVGLPMRVVRTLLRNAGQALAKRLGDDLHFQA